MSKIKFFFYVHCALDAAQVFLSFISTINSQFLTIFNGHLINLDKANQIHQIPSSYLPSSIRSKHRRIFSSEHWTSCTVCVDATANRTVFWVLNSNKTFSEMLDLKMIAVFIAGYLIYHNICFEHAKIWGASDSHCSTYAVQDKRWAIPFVIREWHIEFPKVSPIHTSFNQL